jgi:diadenosine tetraphosphate (Ap4A) HIT family hydrolase
VELNRLQYYRGYTFFACRRCVPELNDLPRGWRDLFLHEMAEVAHAVQRAFQPVKLNYELLGNTIPHLHWHLVPRHRGDAQLGRPVWENADFVQRQQSGELTEDHALRDGLRSRLLGELRRVDVVIEREFC